MFRRIFSLRGPFLAALTAGALWSSIGCDSRADDREVDLEAERNRFLILQLALNSSAVDFQTACTSATTQGLACAATSGNTAAYPALLTTSFKISIATQDSAGICAAYVTAPLLAQATNAARVCYFSCERDTWQSGAAAGQCAAVNYTTYSRSAIALITRCATACLGSATFFLF